MKNVIFAVITAILIMGSFVGCKKVSLTDPDQPIDESIILTVTNSATGGNILLDGDTVKVPAGTKIILQAKSSIPAISWLWNFGGGATDTGAVIVHTFSGTPPTVIPVMVTRIDGGGQTVTKTFYFKLSWGTDGQAPFVWVSAFNLGNGSFNEVFAASKEYLHYAGNYFKTGTMYNWVSVPIADADTNFNLVNGVLVAPNAGDVGKYVAIRMTLSPDTGYKLAVGRGAIWGQFDGPYSVGSGLLKFSILADGRGVPSGGTPIVSTSHPGIANDTIVNFDLLSDRVRIYTNNGQAFNGQTFVRLQDSSGTWLPIIMESAVPNFPNWGVAEVLYSQFPIKNLLVITFGSNMGFPTAYNPSRNLSIFWDPNYLVLKVMIRQVENRGKKGWVIERVPGIK